MLITTLKLSSPVFFISYDARMVGIQHDLLLSFYVQHCRFPCDNLWQISKDTFKRVAEYCVHRNWRIELAWT